MLLPTTLTFPSPDILDPWENGRFPVAEIGFDVQARPEAEAVAPPTIERALTINPSVAATEIIFLNMVSLCFLRTRTWNP